MPSLAPPVALAVLSAGEPAPSITVQQSVELALERNPGIQAALADVAAARVRMTGASVPLRSNPEVEAAVGPRRTPDGRSTDLGFGISQRFELFGQRGARIDAAEALVGAAVVAVESRRVRVAAEVLETFARRQVPALQLSAEQVPRPGRPLPSELGGHRVEHPLQGLPEAGVDPGHAVVGAPIEQALFTGLDEAARRLDDRGQDAAEVAGDLVSRQSLSELGDHEEAQRGAVAIGLSASGDQSASRRPIEPGNLVHGKVSSSVVVDLASATIDGLAFPFNFLPAVRGLSADRDSRTMV